MTALPDNMVARWLLVLVLLAGAYFFSGFLVPVLAALVIGFASWPAYQKLVRKCRGNTTLAATIALLLIAAGLVIPLGIGISYALQEIHAWFDWLMVVNRQGWPVPDWVASLPGGGEWLAESWMEYVGTPGALNEIVQEITGNNIGNIYRWLLTLSSTAFNVILTALFMLITLFFIFKDGARLAAQIDVVGERVLPLHWQRFSRVVPATVSSTVFGMGIIAVGEGVVLGISYAIAGVPSPAALGVVTAFMALIPGGAPLAFTSVSIYLALSGNIVAAIGLMAWGTTELFIVDKTLRPRLVGGPIKLPFLPTFFGLVGGVATMGFVGLFVGPVLMALLVAIWSEWVHSIAQEKAAAGEPIPLPQRPGPEVEEGVSPAPASALRSSDPTD